MTARLPLVNSAHGLNSDSASIGHAMTSAARQPASRRMACGSRRMTAEGAAVLKGSPDEVASAATGCADFCTATPPSLA